MEIQGVHQGQPVLTAGEPLDQAKGVMILVHGRGATAASILELAAALDQPGFAYLAPQAAGNVWYPYSFLAPLAMNEPGLSSALGVLDTVLSGVTAAGIRLEKTILLGFSQGACLALEYAARHARRYGGVIGLSGGLIGPDDTPRDYAGSLQRTPVLLGCSDIDPHIPKERVLSSAEVFRRLDGDVTERLYPGMGHTVNQDELAYVVQIMQAVLIGTGSHISDQGRSR
jgi:phospholipase/carboxylesterase